MTDFSELPTADQEAISKTLLTLLKAFDDRDAEPGADEQRQSQAAWLVRQGRAELALDVLDAVVQRGRTRADQVEAEMQHEQILRRRDRGRITRRG